MTTDQNGEEPKDQAQEPSPAIEAPANIASWDIFYQDCRGMECHLQLKAASVESVLKEAKGAAGAIMEAGGKPSARMAGRPQVAIANGNDKVETKAAEGKTPDAKPAEPAKNGNGEASPREPTYVDPQGTRHCNRRLTDGTVCGGPVTQKEGRYGTFWSCPNFKAHAPNGAR